MCVYGARRSQSCITQTHSYICDDHHHDLLVDKLCDVDFASSLVQGAVDVGCYDTSFLKQLQKYKKKTHNYVYENSKV